MVGLLVVKRGGAPDPVVSSVGAAVNRVLGQQSLTVNGSNILPGDKVFIDGVEYATSGSSSPLTATIPAAEVSGSPLRVAGAKAVTIRRGATVSNSVNWTVNAWTAEASLTGGMSGAFGANSTDTSGAADAAEFTPWVDRFGTANGVHASSPRPSRYTGALHLTTFNGVDSVFMNQGFTIGNGHVGASHYMIALAIKFTDLTSGRHFLTNSAASARLFCPSDNVLRWEVVNAGTLALDLTGAALSTPMLLTMRCDGSTTDFRINLGTTSGVDFITGASKTLSTGTSGWFVGASDGSGTNNIGHFIARLGFARDTAIGNTERDQWIRDWGIETGIF